MAKLFIVGNGFDLAHGYKTSYNDFFDYLFKSPNQDGSNDLFEVHEKKIIGAGGGLETELSITYKNALFKTMHRNHKLKAWSDIEEDYFNELFYRALSKSYSTQEWRKKDILQLNYEFSSIRKSLQNYLNTAVFPINLNIQKLDNMKKLIREITKGDSDVEVLNFNYSDVVKNYFPGKDVISIHGELRNLDNPIVFGYAAKEEDTTKLSEIYNDEYIRYIKRFLYLTDGQSRLNRFLEENADIEVVILGHSCGMSDRLILSKIFNHKDVEKITICYYKDLENYRTQANNIYRLLSNKNHFDKILNFTQSPKFPQMRVEEAVVNPVSN